MAAARTEELFREHGRMVGGLCRALLRDRVEAEDAAQQVFLSAHRALLNGSRPREAAAWLATIARNECVARVRTRMRAPLATDDVEQQSALPDPLAEAIRRADLAALWRAIRQLPAPQREALLLREFGGLTYDELAAALAVSESAVESLLFRARSALRTRLEPVYAALSGASWVESLGRLFAGGSSVAAPVAAKVVALGVGAAVVTGGAVEAPRLLDHRPSAAAAADVRKTESRPAHAPVLPVSATSLQVFAPLTRVSRSTGALSTGHRGEHTAEPADRREGGDGGTSGSTGGSTSGDDGRESAAATPAGGHESDSGGGSGGNVSGGDGGRSGSDGGDGGSTGTVSTTEATTTTQETTTQETTTQETTTTERPTTTTDTTTTVTVPVAGEDGG